MTRGLSANHFINLPEPPMLHWRVPWREELSSLHYEQEPGHNLTFGEHTALMNLKGDNSLVINKADKGSTIVVQNHSDYAQAGFIRLSDVKVYQKLDGDITPQVCIKLDAFLKRLFTEVHPPQKKQHYSTAC